MSNFQPRGGIQTTTLKTYDGVSSGDATLATLNEAALVTFNQIIASLIVPADQKPLTVASAQQQLLALVAQTPFTAASAIALSPTATPDQWTNNAGGIVDYSGCVTKARAIIAANGWGTQA